MKTSAELAQDIENGIAVIANCDLGFGVRIESYPEGDRLRIYVPERIIGPGYDGPALREWMEETAVAWLRQVAPHRLALGADDR